MNRSPKEEKYLKDFGRRVEALRSDAGFTQEQLAAKAGLTAETISAIERGKRFTRLSNLHAISKALRLEVVDLFYDLKHR